MGPEGSPEATARLRDGHWGSNRPIPVQYGEWLGRALRGDLGISIQYDLPVGRLIVSRLPVTLPLTLMAAALMMTVALPLGLYAARRHRRRRRLSDDARLAGRDRRARRSGPASSSSCSSPFTSAGCESGGFDGWSAGIWPGVRSLLLPALALGLFQTAVLVRATRSAVLDVLREDYVRTARAKGVGELSVIGAHTLAQRARSRS